MRPTAVVYEAWSMTDQLPYSTSKEDRMIELLDPAEHKDYVTYTACECYLCGAEAESGMTKKKLLPKTFNDHDKAASPSSDYVCSACCFMILTNPNRRQAIRWFHYAASAVDGMEICNVGDLRRQLLDPPQPPFVICATTSQKKHLMWYLETSFDRERFYVTLETEKILVDRETFREQLRFVERLYNAGISKSNILDNMIPYGKLTIDEWMTASQMISEYKKANQFKLAVFVAQKEE